jgi:dTDP-4-amino-4,6-dideoxygalactose transaminase
MDNRWQREYEEAFRELVGVIGARAFRLGRHALLILLKALGVNKDDKVGVCGFTCLSVIEAVKVCGAIPVYLDVDEHLCIEPKEILRQKKDSLKVVILQHTFGIPGRLEQLLSACSKIGAAVVEDCAQSFGCSWKGRPLGSFGKAAIYSSEWGKPYTTGQGGMLTVNSKELLDEVDQGVEDLALPAFTKSELILECQRRVYSFLSGPQLEGYLRYTYGKLREIGIIKEAFELKSNFCLYRGYVRFIGKMTAKAGLKQIENWSKLQQKRRRNTEMIEEHFNRVGLALWPKPDEADVTMLRYPILTTCKSKIVKQARKHKLDIAGWYMSPVHPLQGNNLTKVDYYQGCCPRTEKMISQLVHLPTGPGLNLHNMEEMVKIISQN